MSKLSLDKQKIKILLLEGVHENAVENLKSQGYTNIEYHKKSLPKEELIEKIKDSYFIGIRSRTKLTEEVLSHAKKLIGIGTFCIGTNQVDLDAAKNFGIPVFNAPFSNTRSVAELIIAETVFLFRGILEKNALAHEGGWKKSAENSFEIRGKNMGIIGYGHIGTQVGVLAEMMGMNVYYYDIEEKLSYGNNQRVGTLEELLQVSDIVSLHVPETPETINMMNEKTFSFMKKGSYFLNASRGTVVDIDALVKNLETGKILGAAIDVFPKEPKSKTEEFVSPLRKFQNVVLTPHIGGSTQEAQKNIGIEVSQKLVKYSDNGSTLSSVNFPEVNLPEHKGDSHRILHIHKNIPGVMGKINQIFSENNVNIIGQYLQTSDDIGYVVIDINTECFPKILEQIKNIEGTIRSRILH